MYSQIGFGLSTVLGPYAVIRNDSFQQQSYLEFHPQAFMKSLEENQTETRIEDVADKIDDGHAEQTQCRGAICQNKYCTNDEMHYTRNGQCNPQ